MKSFIVLFAALVSASSFAAPQVGDTATYTGTQGGTTAQITTTLIAFNPSTAKFTMKTDVVTNGQTQTQTEEQAVDAIMSVESVNQLLANCVAAGGVLGNVTVRAGSFNSCTISGMSFAPVPFGFVKAVTTENGVSMVMELQSFRFGN